MAGGSRSDGSHRCKASPSRRRASSAVGDPVMKNARELMLGYIEGTAEQSAALFAEQGHARTSLSRLDRAPAGPQRAGGDPEIPDLPARRRSIRASPSRASRSTSIRLHRCSPNTRSTIGRGFRARTCGNNSSATWRLKTARSSGCAKPSTSLSPPKPSIRTDLRTSSPSDRDRALGRKPFGSA